MGPDAMILVFWMLNFRPAFSLSSFTFIKRLFSSSSLSAGRVGSSAYLGLLQGQPQTLCDRWAPLRARNKCFTDTETYISYIFTSWNILLLVLKSHLKWWHSFWAHGLHKTGSRTTSLRLCRRKPAAQTLPGARSASLCFSPAGEFETGKAQSPILKRSSGYLPEIPEDK